MSMGNSHWSKIENSPRLQRVFALMKDCHCHSTREIERGADVSAAGEAMTEIRRNFERNDLPKEYCGFFLPESRQKRGNMGGRIATYQFMAVREKWLLPATTHEVAQSGENSKAGRADIPSEQMDFLRTTAIGTAAIKT